MSNRGLANSWASALGEAIADGHSHQAGRDDGELADQPPTMSHLPGR